MKQPITKQNIWAETYEYYITHLFNICFGCSKEPSHWDGDGSFCVPTNVAW